MPVVAMRGELTNQPTNQPAIQLTNSPPPHHLRRRRKLPRVPLGMLGGVKEQPEHGRRKSRAPHLARLEESGGIGPAKLSECALHRRVELGDERLLDPLALVHPPF